MEELKCVYCLSVITRDSRQGREHLIPKFLGVYDSKTITLEFVCDACNKYFADTLDTPTKEDSLEGYYSSVWFKKDKTHIPLRGNRFNIKVLNDKVGELGNVLPYLVYQDGLVYYQAFVAFKNKTETYQFYAVDYLVKNKSNIKGKDIKKRLSVLSKKDILVFGGIDYTKEQVIAVLKEYEINYLEKEAIPLPFQDKPEELQFEFEYTIDDITRRFLARIAFNYLCYCAFKSGNGEIIYSQDFDQIRSFVRYGEGNLPFSNKLGVGTDTIDNKIESKKHFVGFRREEDNIVGRVTFFGITTYEMIISKIPKSLVKNNFGCCTFFDPINKVIEHDIVTPLGKIRNENKFGLYNRNVTAQ